MMMMTIDAIEGTTTGTTTVDATTVYTTLATTSHRTRSIEDVIGVRPEGTTQRTQNQTETPALVERSASPEMYARLGCLKDSSSLHQTPSTTDSKNKKAGSTTT